MSITASDQSARPSVVEVLVGVITVATAFVLAHVPGFVAARRLGVAFRNPTTWVQWDSNHYLDIAVRGYYLEYCQPPAETAWCGSTGWFPGYPLLARLLNPSRAHIPMTAWVVAQLSFLALLTVLWFGFLRRRTRPEALTVMVLASFFPGGIYYLAVYPMALAVLGLLILTLGLYRDHLWLSAVGAALAAIVYPVAVLAGPAVTAALLLHPVSRKTRRGPLLWPAAGSAVGVGTVLAIMQVKAGRWNGYFLTQSSYHHAIRFPLVHIAQRIAKITDPVNFGGSVTGAQHLLIAIMMITIGWNLVRRRLMASPVEWAVYAMGLTMYLASNTLGFTASVYRHESLLLPCLLLLTPLKHLRLSLLLPFVVVAFWEAALYLNGTLM